MRGVGDGPFSLHESDFLPEPGSGWRETVRRRSVVSAVDGRRTAPGWRPARGVEGPHVLDREVAGEFVDAPRVLSMGGPGESRHVVRPLVCTVPYKSFV